MKAIVLCPGPSLAQYESQPAELVVCVNRAALDRHCDFWAALDYPVIRDNGPNVLGTPKLLTQRQTAHDLGLRPDGKLSRFSEIVTVEDIALTIPKDIVDRGWWYVTMGAAIVFCAWKGATEIRVYGADWNGTKDYDGKEAGLNRAPERWEKERKLFEDLRAYFAGRGVMIQRI